MPSNFHKYSFELIPENRNGNIYFLKLDFSHLVPLNF